MKKIYAMLGLAAMMTLNASAAEFKSKIGENNFEGWKLEKMSEMVAPATLMNSTMSVPQNSMSTRAGNSGVEGVYCMQWVALGDSVPTYGGIQVTVDASGTTGKFLGFVPIAALTPPLTIDNANKTFSIKPQSFGDGGDWKDPDSGITYKTEVKLVHWLFNEDGKGAVEVNTPIEFHLNEDGTFGTKDGWRDIFQIYAEIENYPEEGAILTYNAPLRGYGMMGIKYPEELDNTGWVNIGDATIENNGFIGYNEPYEVTVQKSTEMENVFRLVNPFADFYKNQVNLCEGELRFDVSTPTCPLIQYGPAIYNGMLIHEVYPEAGWTEENPFVYFVTFSTYVSGFYYSQDFEGEDEVFTPEELGEEFGEEEAGIVKGDVITFAGLDDCISMNQALYKWNNDADTYAETFVVRMPEGWQSGVEEIISNEIAPVKYYNMQGMEVKAPEAGELVIMKKGSKTSKFIAK